MLGPNASADAADVPLASGGKAGGVGLADALSLALAVLLGSGFGFADGSLHPEAATPRTTASAASERTVRLRDTDATPKNRSTRAGRTNRTRPLQPTQAPLRRATPAPRSVDNPRRRPANGKIRAWTRSARPRRTCRTRSASTSGKPSPRSNRRRAGAPPVLGGAAAGAGKTLVGLERSSPRPDDRRARARTPRSRCSGATRGSEFAPATVATGTDRDLAAPVTVLTYQSLATFERTTRIDEDGRRRRRALLDRLHENGRTLIAAMRAAGPITIVLDECHHLLEVWGRLLAEVLASCPTRTCIGLTATPPTVLDARTRRRWSTSCSATSCSAQSIPAAVREGLPRAVRRARLADARRPAEEAEWLARPGRAVRQLTHRPGRHRRWARRRSSCWFDRRFLELTTPWARFERDDPELARAALRLVHAELLALPDGARLREEHRHDADRRRLGCADRRLGRKCLRSPRCRPTSGRRGGCARRCRAVGYQLTRTRHPRWPLAGRPRARPQRGKMSRCQRCSRPSTATSASGCVAGAVRPREAAATLPRGSAGVLDAGGRLGPTLALHTRRVARDRAAPGARHRSDGRRDAGGRAADRRPRAYDRSRLAGKLALEPLDDASGPSRCLDRGGRGRAASGCGSSRGSSRGAEPACWSARAALLGEGWDAEAAQQPGRPHHRDDRRAPSCRPAGGRCGSTRTGRRRSR